MTAARSVPVDLPGLTSIRGLAAWWVVLYHVRDLFAHGAPAAVYDLLAHGNLAVDLFFILSGFVIQLNYAGRMAATRAALSDFFVRRLARIYPLHLLMLLAVIVYVLTLVATQRPVPGDYAAERLPLHVLLMHNWGLTEGLHWNVPSWSISTEWGAYLLFPWLVLFGRWERRPVWLLLALVAALLAGLHGLFALNGHDGLGQDIAGLGLVRCLVQFSIGSILCVLWQRIAEARRTPLGLLCAGAGLLLAIAALWRGIAETAWVPLLWVLLVMALALLPVGRGNPFGWRPLIYLGDISYATYLCHYPLLIWWKALFVADAGRVALWQGPGFVLAVLLLSILLYHGYERPAQRWILSRWRARRAALQAASA